MVQSSQQRCRDEQGTTMDHAWTELEGHFQNVGRTLDMRELFKKDKDRVNKMNVSLENGLLQADFSKNIIDDRGLELLFNLANKADIRGRIRSMFSGVKINETENRAVQHVCLRAAPFEPQDWECIPDSERQNARENLEKMRDLCEKITDGTWKGITGKKIKHIVNIGIGGSDLGPAMATIALQPYHNQSKSCNKTLLTEEIPKNDLSAKVVTFKVHFVSNVDGMDMDSVLSTIIEVEGDLETTLFIVTSKTFTTSETLTNAETAIEALSSSIKMDGIIRSAIVRHHFVAVTAKPEIAENFEIDRHGIVPFGESVGGRYSIWSAVGLPLMLAIGYDQFEEFLLGAYLMDKHFFTKPLESNMPVLMGLIGVWYINLFGVKANAVIPYEQLLKRLPAYLQQLDMESNGKTARIRIDSVSQHDQSSLQNLSSLDDGLSNHYGCMGRKYTGPIIFGEPGTNSQHAFFQLLHQGTHLIPVDFLVGLVPAKEKNHPVSLVRSKEHHRLLLANCIAQAEALMTGGVMGDDPNNLHRTFPGNRPSNTIVYQKLTPRVLGALIALYEHKVFVQGVIWGINSYDQWGVELGKKLASSIDTDLLEPSVTPSHHDASTQFLIDLFKSCN